MTKDDIRLIDPFAKETKAYLSKLGLVESTGGGFTIRFLEIGGRAKALSDLDVYLKKDRRDVEKLIKNINLQLNSKELLRDKKKLQRTKEGVLEFKANNGHSRLFGFLSGSTSKQEIIICSHGYWKTDGKGSNSRQQAAFRLADKFRLLYESINE